MNDTLHKPNMETKDIALIAYLELVGITECSSRFEGGSAFFSYDHPDAIAEMELFFNDHGGFKTFHQKLRSKKSQIDAMKGRRDGGRKA